VFPTRVLHINLSHKDTGIIYLLNNFSKFNHHPCPNYSLSFSGHKVFVLKGFRILDLVLVCRPSASCEPSGTTAPMRPVVLFQRKALDTSHCPAWYVLLLEISLVFLALDKCPYGSYDMSFHSPEGTFTGWSMHIPRDHRVSWSLG
jgi:hypothetical protein